MQFCYFSQPKILQDIWVLTPDGDFHIECLLIIGTHLLLHQPSLSVIIIRIVILLYLLPTSLFALVLLRKRPHYEAEVYKHSPNVIYKLNLNH